MKQHFQSRQSSPFNVPIVTDKGRKNTRGVLIMSPHVGQRINLPVIWTSGDDQNKTARRTGTIVKVYPTYFLIRWDTNKCLEGFCYVNKSRLASEAAAVN